MQRLLGGWGRWPAVVAVVAAATVPGGSAWGATDDVLVDRPGDATAVGWQCVLGCPPAPEPVSEPSIDLLSVDMLRDGNDLVFETKVVDLDNVPMTSAPDDKVGWNIGFSYGDVGVYLVAQRSASHVPQPSFVQVSHWNEPAATATRDIAVSYDADDTVRVRLPLSVLNGLVDEVCSTCANIGNGTVFTRPLALTYVLATTPGGDTGPTHGDRTFDPVDPTWVVG